MKPIYTSHITTQQIDRGNTDVILAADIIILRGKSSLDDGFQVSEDAGGTWADVDCRESKVITSGQDVMIRALNARITIEVERKLLDYFVGDMGQRLPILTADSGSGLARPAGLANMSAGGIAISPASGHAQGLINKLVAGAADAGILVVSDSTGNAVPTDPMSSLGEWPFRLAQWLAVQYPAYTVKIVPWDEVGEAAYGTPVTIQTGTGARTLTIWNAAKSGSKSSYVLGSRYGVAVNKLPVVDLLIVNHGHNLYGAESQDLIGLHYLELTETVLLSHPGIGVLLIGQNPARDTADNDIKVKAARDVCALRGFGFVDVWSEFVKRGKAASLYVDALHPSTGVGTVEAPTGVDLFLSPLIAHFTGLAVEPARCYSLLSDIKNAGNLLLNGDFSAFASALPDNWTASGATVTKDTTIPFGSNGYSVKIVNSGAAQGYIDQLLSSSLRDEYKGQTLICIAAVYVSVGQDDKSGRLALTSTSNSVNNYAAESGAEGGWRWKFLLAKTDVADTYIRVRLYGNTAFVAGGSTNFGAVYLRPGRMPPGRVPSAVIA